MKPFTRHDVFANGLKTTRVVKLIFHTVLWGGKNTHTHKHTHWNMEDGDTGGLGGRGGLGGGLVMFMLCVFLLGSHTRTRCGRGWG